MYVISSQISSLLSPSVVEFWHPHVRDRIFYFYRQHRVKLMNHNVVSDIETQVLCICWSILHAHPHLMPSLRGFLLISTSLPTISLSLRTFSTEDSSYWSGNSQRIVKLRKSEGYKLLPQLVCGHSNKSMFTFLYRGLPRTERGQCSATLCQMLHLQQYR